MTMKPIGRAELLLALESRSTQLTPGGCRLWTGAKNADGYGVVYLRNGFRMTAHRAAWLCVHGQIHEGKELCHRCDTPACIKVGHLFAGTHAENIADMRAKGRGRGASGERNRHAKLTAVQVSEIRRRHIVEGASSITLAREFGVSKSAVNRAIAARSWSSVRSRVDARAA